MEEENECDVTTGNHIHRLYFVNFLPSPWKVIKKEFEEQYQLMNNERIRINEELAQWKGEEREINKKLMLFSDLDKQIEWKVSEIKNLQRWNQDRAINLRLPIDSIPRTTGYLSLTGIDARTRVTPDGKRCKKRLIKNGRIDVEYIQQVQEEHLSIEKSSGIRSPGTKELKDMIESMVQRIQHGNKKRADEMRMYQEIKNVNETKEIFIAREPVPRRQQWYTRELRSKRDLDWERSLQHKISIRLDYIENIKRRQIRLIAQVRRLKADLEHVRKSISYLNKKLENVNSKRLEAYKRAYELGEENIELNSSYNEYQSFKKHVKELARKGDVSKLKYVCDTQVEGFIRRWNDSKAFREAYLKKKLGVPITRKRVS